MKKLVSLTLLLFVLISSSSVYARSIDTQIQEFMDSPAPDFSELSKANGSKIINEFDAIIEKEIISELRYSYSDKHDETLKFKQEIINLSNSSRNELEKMNFNDRQIDAILSTKGLSADKVSNDVARRASANFRFNMYKNRFEYGDYAVVDAYWAWESAPVWAGKDTVVFGFSDGFTANLDRTVMKVTYRDLDGNYKGEQYYSPNGLVQGLRFDFEQSYGPGGLRSLSSGKVYLVIDNRENKDYVEVHGKYLHNYLGVLPSINISGSGLVSIGFSQNTREMGDGYIVMP